MRERLGSWLRPVVFLGRNPLTLTGAVLTTSAGITLVLLWIAEIFRGGPIHPYLGILYFLILPTIFVLGLILMPIGALLRRRKLRGRGELPMSIRRLTCAIPCSDVRPGSWRWQHS